MAHNNYAWHLARRGEFDKAAKHIAAAGALGDGFQALYDTQGHVFMMLGRAVEAEVAFGKAMTTGGPDLVRRYQQTLYAKGYDRSEENTSEPQSLMRISYAVFCLKKKK